MNFYLKYTHLLLALLLVLALPKQLDAHAPDQSYIFLSVYEDAMGGLIEITTDDLNKALGLNLERGITEADLAPYLDQIKAHLLEKIAFSSSLGDHPIKFTDIEFQDLELGYFIMFNFELENVSSIPDSLNVRYEFLVTEDSNHKGMFVVAYNWKAGIHDNESLVSMIFTKNNTEDTLSLTDASIMKGLIAMIKSGMWHIYIGLDHILFLLALLLPAVVRRKTSDGVALSRGRWVPVERFSPALWYVLKIVTLFTIAHTITLSLAALQIITLPSFLVEAIIALSIALAAYHNIRPFFKNETLILAFGFGLFHGFGFASVLGEVGLKGEYMVYSLLGFNVGVELGQMTIILAIFPILYFLRNTKLYPKILVYGSILLIIISLYWFVERIFGIDMPVDEYIGDFINRVVKKIAYIIENGKWSPSS
ncbi:MAG: HupE/UreJ family protein [Bacteroidota bacterium]